MHHNSPHDGYDPVAMASWRELVLATVLFVGVPAAVMLLIAHPDFAVGIVFGVAVHRLTPVVSRFVKPRAG